MKKKWNFMLDQGGTFTDVIAIRPDGKMITTPLLHKCSLAFFAVWIFKIFESLV